MKLSTCVGGRCMCVGGGGGGGVWGGGACGGGGGGLHMKSHPLVCIMNVVTVKSLSRMYV